MANVTNYASGEVIANRNGMNNAGFPSTGVLVAEYDASKGGAGIGDTVDIAVLPAGTIVNSAVLEVVTVDGATVAVGSAAGDAYVAATAAGSAGMTLGAGADLGTLLAAESTLRLTVSVAAADTLKCKVYLDVTVVG
jgi:hypothetical protein